ncbi:MAG: prepilin-type N-terminal cleavage/methylation domain-containing protein [Enterobacterales bacterium]|nr:prepilin-type N-terminal cleavage/methylation domain-containing protein [Enterobacterales bacterium]
MKQSGFTLIELVVVLVIIALLSAVAVPKYIGLQTSARSASVDGISASFRSAVNLVHMTWFVKGHTTSTSDLQGFGNNDLEINNQGWPTSTSGATTISSASHCVLVWRGILDNAPTVATYTGLDYQASLVSGATTSCDFTLKEDSSMHIIYDSLTGKVSRVND